MILGQLLDEFLKLQDKEKAITLQRFFKTGKGQYGENDIFLGITVPKIRNFAKNYINITSIHELKNLLSNKYHEVRLLSLIIMTEKMKRSLSEEIFELYLENYNFINNWDLVDLSSPLIVGKYLYEKDQYKQYKYDILYDFSTSDHLWKKRISIISTLYFIRKNHYQTTLDISLNLLNDKHDLIQKAVGWMLREVGKKNFEVEFKFLKENYKKMGRTMLRYSIEKFDENLRQSFLKGTI